MRNRSCEWRQQRHLSRWNILHLIQITESGWFVLTVDCVWVIYSSGMLMFTFMYPNTNIKLLNKLLHLLVHVFQTEKLKGYNMIFPTSRNYDTTVWTIQRLYLTHTLRPVLNQTPMTENVIFLHKYPNHNLSYLLSYPLQLIFKQSVFYFFLESSLRSTLQ